jgi:hypothetical protein
MDKTSKQLMMGKDPSLSSLESWIVAYDAAITSTNVDKVSRWFLSANADSPLVFSDDANVPGGSTETGAFFVFNKYGNLFASKKLNAELTSVFSSTAFSQDQTSQYVNGYSITPRIATSFNDSPLIFNYNLTTLQYDNTSGTFTPKLQCKDSVGNSYSYGKLSAGNVCFVKFSSDNTILWAKSMQAGGSGSTYDSVKTVVDVSGNVYFLLDNYNTTGSRRGMVLIKINSSGNEVWKYIFYITTTNSTMIPFDMVLDTSGQNIYLLYATTSGSNTFSVAKISSDATLVWRKQINTTLAGAGNPVVPFKTLGIDQSDNLYVPCALSNFFGFVKINSSGSAVSSYKISASGGAGIGFPNGLTNVSMNNQPVVKVVNDVVYIFACGTYATTTPSATYRFFIMRIAPGATISTGTKSINSGTESIVISSDTVTTTDSTIGTFSSIFQTILNATISTTRSEPSNNSKITDFSVLPTFHKASIT